MPPASQPPPPQSAAAERIEGVVVRITFQNPENGYSVVRVEPRGDVPPAARAGDGVITVVGVLPGVEVGQALLCEGEWIRDPRFGMQFKANWFKPMLPSGVKGIEAYLASGAIRGIGPVMARRIVAHFGERTFELIDADPRRLGEVPGIGPKTLAKLRAAWTECRHDRELITFLGEHNISPAIAARLRKEYGDNALAIVRSNPYRLITDVRGIGFHRADEIARKIGLPPDAPERIDAALAHALERQADEGHTWQPREMLVDQVIALIGAEPERVQERLDEAILKQRLVVDRVEEQDAVFLRPLHEAEARVAHCLRKMLAARRRLPQIDGVAALADFEQRARFRLAPAQRKAVLEFVKGGLLVLTGGPGTGKTTTIRSIIELFTQARMQVKLAAPTGRAARRLSETAKLPAETIHRLLGYQAPLGTFGRDAANPIEAQLIIIDEASMLDAALAAHLFAAIAPGSCLLLVGDEDQLPSVGPGNVLGDIIASARLPLVRLTEVFRQAQASLIVTNAHRINQGHMPLLNPPQPAPGEPEPDFFFIEREEPAQIIEAIRTLAAERIPRKFGLDPAREIQLLTPMRRGELGVDALTRELRELLNPQATAPAAATVGGLAAGDRVMQTANNYDKQVFNGDIGRVAHVNADTQELLIDFDGRAISYLRDELDQLVPAYAITIHKSQGSEYPAVIIPIHTQHWIMLQRNLIYTAITRARRLVCLVGTKRALRRAVANATRARRLTALRAMLQRD